MSDEREALRWCRARIKVLEAERASYMGDYHANRVKELEGELDTYQRWTVERIKELEAERDDAESAWLRTLEDLGQAEQTNAALLAALERIDEHTTAFPERPLDLGCVNEVRAAIAQAKGDTDD